MASIREMKKVIKADKAAKAAKEAYLAAKAALVADDDVQDAEAIIANVKATRDAFILATINAAKLAPRAAMFHKTLDDLYLKSKSSPRIQENLVNHLMQIELK